MPSTLAARERFPALSSSTRRIRLCSTARSERSPSGSASFAVPAAEGNYYFQCDPHALLGMVGKLEVERDDD